MAEMPMPLDDVVNTVSIKLDVYVLHFCIYSITIAKFIVHGKPDGDVCLQNVKNNNHWMAIRGGEVKGDVSL